MIPNEPKLALESTLALKILKESADVPITESYKEPLLKERVSDELGYEPKSSAVSFPMSIEMSPTEASDPLLNFYLLEFTGVLVQ